MAQTFLRILGAYFLRIPRKFAPRILGANFLRILGANFLRILGANFLRFLGANFAQILRKNVAPRSARARHARSASFDAQTGRRKPDLKIGDSFLRHYRKLGAYTVNFGGVKRPVKNWR